MNKYENIEIIGSDETGVSDYLTPLIAAAAFVPKENIEKLRRLGVQDSKKLSDQQIKKLYFDIKDLIKFTHKKLTQSGYNKLNRSFNAHELKTLLHVDCISRLEKLVKADLVIVDEFASEKNWNKYVNHLESSTLDIPSVKTKIEFVTKAESVHISVAAASIMARAILLFEMKNQNDEYRMTFPLGTNDRVVQAARDFIEMHGKENLFKVAKLSFKTTKKFD